MRCLGDEGEGGAYEWRLIAANLPTQISGMWAVARSALTTDPLTPRRPSAFRPFPVRLARKQFPADLLNRYGMAVKKHLCFMGG